MYGSIAAAHERKMGTSPMRQEYYVDKVNYRRRSMGVRPYELKEDSPEIDVLNMKSEIMLDSWGYCRKVLDGEVLKGDAYNVA